MSIKYTCNKCGGLSEVPSKQARHSSKCKHCGTSLSRAKEATGETSAAIGLIGGAVLGAAVGGPWGAIVGGLIGGALGKHDKGIG